MIKEFKAFILRGNVLDLAVGIVIGAAFTKIVSSFVSDVLMPPVGLLLGNVDLSNLYLNLSRTPYATLAEAKKAGAPTLNYGVFLNNIVDFVIVAFVIFLVVKAANRFTKPKVAAVVSKACQYCLMDVPVAAKKCGHCTSAI
jgi:large conductance mechanosensitive channel